jgi:hypothetical protein
MTFETNEAMLTNHVTELAKSGFSPLHTNFLITPLSKNSSKS